MRFLRRKNLPKGCSLPSPCFCRLSGPQAKQLSPLHAIWPAIAARVRPGELLPTGYYGPNANTTIKAALEKLESRMPKATLLMGSEEEMRKNWKRRGPNGPL